jgi:hypothetical protein
MRGIQLTISIAALATFLAGCGEKVQLVTPPPATSEGTTVPSPPADRDSSATRPISVSTNGYASSAACRECHKHEHATWYSSYHRKMTQVITPETALGDFDGREIAIADSGERYRMIRKDGRLWVEMSNNQAATAGTGRQRPVLPIVLSTGSHHMQIYWFATGKGRTLGMVPVVYLRSEDRWVPRSAVFIDAHYPLGTLNIGRWNQACSLCHSTHPQENLLPDSSHDTKVAEFGIACEACHGPGAEHIRVRRQTGIPDHDPIINPANLSASLSAQICGSCHSVFETLTPGKGIGHFIPGTRLADSRYVVRRDADTVSFFRRFSTTGLRPIEEVNRDLDRSFWPDGMIRITGREYNGLLDTDCHTRGKMSCLSCHRLHQDRSDSRPSAEWADDLLHPEMASDQGCTQCHEPKTYQDKGHTHHSPDSPGSRCYNCHMPHTNFGLLKAVRSHQVDSPNVSASTDHGRPNACNLCHLDKPLAWTAKHLSAWYGIPPPELGREQRELAAAVLWILKGDANQRSLLTWHLNWPPARQVSGIDWMPPYVSALMRDDYPAIRLMAAGVLRSIPEYSDISFDAVADWDRIQASAQQVFRRWQAADPTRRPLRPELLIKAGGRLDTNAFLQLILAKDNRPVTLAE